MKIDPALYILPHSPDLHEFELHLEADAFDEGEHWSEAEIFLYYRYVSEGKGRYTPHLVNLSMDAPEEVRTYLQELLESLL